MVPVSSPEEVQRFTVLVSVPACPGGLGFVDPLHGDEQLVSEEAFLLCGLVSLLQGTVLVQDLPHSTLSKPTHLQDTTNNAQQTHTHTHSHYEFLFRLHRKASRLPYRGLVVYSEPFWLATTQPQRTEIKASLLTMSQGCAAEQKQPSPTGPRSRAGQRS